LLTLAGFMGSQIIQSAPGFSGKTINVGGHFMLAAFMYMSGAVMARAMASHQEKLAPLMKVQSGADPAIERYAKKARERLDEFEQLGGSHPDSFTTLVLVMGWKELGFIHPLLGGDDSKFTLDDVSWLADLSTIKVNLDYSEPLVKSAFLEGCGFGFEFPDLTETIYRRSMEDHDEQSWAAARRAGLVLPNTPPVIPLEEQESIVLVVLAIYCNSFYPELVGELGLTEILEEALNEG
jgi:hypothetical protein